MASVVKNFMELYENVAVELADKRVDDLPLMNSPVQIIAVLVCYLMFVFKIGPKFMESRNPYKLKEVLVGYNALQMVLNAYLLYRGFPITLNYNWFCEPVDYGDSKDAVTMTYLSWIYFFLKVVDLFDTVFFVLRKNYRQVTFLHVYHHIMMVVVCWSLAKYYAGGHTAFAGIYNSFVHIFMYGYYLLSAMSGGIKATPWYKKYITQLQLLQFMLVYCTYLPMLFMPTCGYPKRLALLLMSQNTMLIYLFGSFYHKNYIRKSKKCEN